MGLPREETLERFPHHLFSFRDRMDTEERHDIGSLLEEDLVEAFAERLLLLSDFEQEALHVPRFADARWGRSQARNDFLRIIPRERTGRRQGVVHERLAGSPTIPETNSLRSDSIRDSSITNSGIL